MGTLRRASWLEKSALVLCDVRDEKTHDRVTVAPRSILRQQVEAAEEMSFQAFAHRARALSSAPAIATLRRGLPRSRAAGWYLEDYHILQGTRTESFHAAARRHLKLSGVPVETSKANGQWPARAHVRYAEALDMPTGT